MQNQNQVILQVMMQVKIMKSKNIINNKNSLKKDIDTTIHENKS